MKQETLEKESSYYFLLGKRVIKKSGKPFKSSLKINTVKGLVRHKELGHLCFIFEEDDSYVECWRCKEV